MILEFEGVPHPAQLRKPVLPPDCKKYLWAYRSISAGRQWGQGGPLPLAVSEVESYIRLAGIEDTDTKMKYLRLMQKLDAVELKNLSRASK